MKLPIVGIVIVSPWVAWCRSQGVNVDIDPAFAEISIAHGLVALYLLGEAGGEHGAEIEHHNSVALFHDKAGIVFDEQYDAAGLCSHHLDLFAEAEDLGLVETGRGFVEQQERRGIDNRSCELHHPRNADRQ